ncbi:MAG: ABC-2 transporter permease [Thermoanaerobaculia bacterium]
MSGILAIFQRELRAYFLSPLAWVILTFMLIINGVIFALILIALNDPLQPPGRPLDLFFGGTFLFWLVLLFVAPVLTMRLLAEERRSGSLEVLMTAPVTEGQVVAGKYLAALVFYAFLWLPTVSYAGVVALHSEIDWGVVAAGYLGVLLVGALFLAVGLFTSATTSNQIVAAVMSFAILLALICVTFLEFFVNAQGLRDALAFINFPEHMSGELAKGIVDTRRLVFYLTGTGFFLFLTGRALESGKWR